MAFFLPFHKGLMASTILGGLQSGGDPDRGFLIADIRPNSAGTAMVDHGPYSHTVTPTGGLTYSTTGVTYDGTNSFAVNVDDALRSMDGSSTASIRLSGVSLASTPGQQTIVACGQTEGAGAYVHFLLYTDGGTLKLSYNFNQVHTTSHVFTTGVEYDIDLYFLNNSALILVDGVPEGVVSGVSFGANYTGSQLLFGRQVNTSSPYIAASGATLSRCAFYRGILKCDIEVPTAPFTSDADTECLVSFDGSDGATSATDESSNAHSLSFDTGFELDTAEKAFGTASLLCPSTGTGVSYTLSGARGTGDFTLECWHKANNLTQTYRSLAGDGLYNAPNSYSWYRLGAIVGNWENQSNKSGGLPAVSAEEFKHHVWQRSNNIMLHWIGGKLVHFYSQTASFTSTTARIGGNNTSLGADGWIDEFRDSSVARYTPTLLSEETAYDTASAESGFNWFASNFYAGKNGSTKVFAEFDVSAGAAVFQKNVSLANNPVVFDTERGATKELYTNSAGGEATGAIGLTAFTASGFTVGNSSLTDATGYNYRSEVFAATLSESITVDSQSLTLKHSGKGFGMIYMDRTLGGASATVSFDLTAMGLIGEPMVILKRLDSTTDWNVSHPGLTNGYYLRLNSSDAETNAGSPETRFGNNSIAVRPTATSLTIGNAAAFSGKIIIYILGEVSATDSENYIKLLDFAHTSGQASYAECGWQPAWSVCKMRDVGSTNWVSRQTKRGTGLATALNSSGAEATDFGAHGPFGVELNGNYAATGNIIGMAIRG